MATKPENTFRNAVHRHLPSSLYHVKMSHMYNAGIADDWYSGEMADLWIEYKFLPVIPQRVNIWMANPNQKHLSTLQMNWLRGRHKEGRNVAVIVGTPKGGVILPGLSWENELTPAEFTAKLCSRKELAEWIERQTVR